MHSSRFGISSGRPADPSSRRIPPGGGHGGRGNARFRNHHHQPPHNHSKQNPPRSNYYPPQRDGGYSTHPASSKHFSRMSQPPQRPGDPHHWGQSPTDDRRPWFRAAADPHGPLKKRQRFFPPNRPRENHQRSRYGPKGDGRQLAAVPPRPPVVPQSRPVDQQHPPPVVTDKKVIPPANAPNQDSPPAQRVSLEGKAAGNTSLSAELKIVPAAAMIPSPPPQPPQQQPPAVVVTGKTLLDEDARTAIVSDGHSPDVFDMSTAGSGSCGGPPLATRPTDIPRHIETPTQKTLPTTTTTPWMDRKIPKKNCKTTVQQITRPSEHDASDVAQETYRVPPAAEETSTLSIDGPDVTPQRKEFLDAGVAPGNETSVTQTEKILVDAEEVQFHTLQQAEPHAAVDLVEHSAMADDSPLATPETSPDSSSAASPPSTASKAEYRRVQIGARVSVYWDGEDEFFDATVTAERPGKKKRFYLEYDDGDEEWINLRKHTWRLLSGGKAKCKVAPSAPLPETETSRPAVDDNKVEVIDKAAESPVIKEDTKAKESIPTSPQKKTETTHGGYNPQDWMHDDDWVSKGAKKSDSDSETDDEEVTKFARKMLGVEKHPIARPKKKPAEPEVVESPPDFGWEDLLSSGIHIPISEKVKGRRRSRAELYTDTGETAEAERVSKKKKRPQKSACRIRVKVSKQKLAASAAAVKPVAEAVLAETASADPEEANRRKKEEARMLTADEVKAILGEEDPDLPCSSHNWVRRSARMPSRSVLDTPKFKLLIEKLKTNDPDMVVLKMKKYLGDPNCPQICIDTVLDALEENTNCQSLYIQNFNEGMRDKQVLRLLQILQKPSCNIWCLNIGETYNVKTKTWKAFTRGLKKTKITHMYASEHTISSELKERIRKTIRENRKKHTMHIDPENLDVIVKCTHCWWNPINAKVLRPHLHRKGYAHILSDKAAQGLRGTDTGASLA